MTITRFLGTLVVLCAFTLPLSSCVIQSLTVDKPEAVSPLEGYASLNNFPFHEAWYGMYFREDKVGYSHFKIEPSGKNYSITTDSMMRLAARKKTDKITMKERITVRPDLSMIGFESRVKKNDRNLKMRGTAKGGEFVVDIDIEGKKLHRTYPLDGQLFHSSAIALMPALRGLKEGRSYSFTVFNASKLSMEKVEQQVWEVKGSPGPNGAVWKIKNRYGRSQIHSWLNKKGLTVLEKALKGSLITMLEDEASAEAFLREKKEEGSDS
jgi:hypothetical protein